MATLHMKAQDNPWKKTLPPMNRTMTSQTEHHDEDMDNFENEEHENHTTLKTLTQEFNNVWQRVATAKGQPTEDINCLECELHRLSLAFCSSLLLEPLVEALQQYTETLCTAQKQTTFANTLIQDISHLQW